MRLFRREKKKVWQRWDGIWMVRCPECGNPVSTRVSTHNESSTHLDAWLTARECGHRFHILLNVENNKLVP